MDSARVLARFDAERLAVMDHPGNAKVFDAGILPIGRPFVARRKAKHGAAHVSHRPFLEP